MRIKYKRDTVGGSMGGEGKMERVLVLKRIKVYGDI
jgi:hypothetical protein